MRPTAKYLQQHKFVTHDHGTAVKTLLPMIQSARRYAVMAAAATPPPDAAGAAAAEGYYSWQADAGAAATVAAARPLSAATPAATPGGGAAYAPTVRAASPFVHASADGGLAGPLSPGLADEGSGTMVVRESAESRPWNSTVISGLASSHASDGHANGGSMSGTLVVGNESSERPAAGMHPEASRDYLAAVQAVSEGHAAELEVAGLPTTAAHRALGIGGLRGPKTESQRWVEKLHNLYSGGAVVPLPFLRACDASPLTLLGIEAGPPASTLVPVDAASGERPGWEVALRELIAESNASTGGPAGAAAAAASHEEAAAMAEEEEELPPAVVAQVQGSPVLLNLATALAACRRQLTAQAAAQAAEPLPPRVREQLQRKANELSDSLRTILCL